MCGVSRLSETCSYLKYAVCCCVGVLGLLALAACLSVAPQARKKRALFDWSVVYELGYGWTFCRLGKPQNLQIQNEGLILASIWHTSLMHYCMIPAAEMLLQYINNK